MRKRPIVGEKHEALRLIVKTTNGKEPGEPALWQVVGDDRPSARVGQGGENARGFVQEQVNQVLGWGDPRAVARHLINSGRDLCPQL